MKFVILDGFLPNFDNIGINIGEHEQVWYPETEPEQVAQRIGDAQGVIVNRVNISSATMDACPNLRYIGTFSTGVNMIDLPAANKRGITVCNVPGYSTAAVAQHTFGLLLEIAGRVGQLDQLVRNGGWNNSSESGPNIVSISIQELWGKTLGLLGAGNIGTQVARQGIAFGMKVIAYDQHRSANLSPDVEFVDFDTLLARSDVLSLHVPLTEETKGIIGQDSLKRMKDGAILLNTARGALIDDTAVAAALDSGKLYAAGIDVMAPEPPLPGNPLIGHPRAVITPHVAWIPRETRERLLKLVEGNIMAFAAGKPVNVVTAV